MENKILNLRYVIASLRQFDCSTTDIALLISLFSCSLLKLLLVLSLLADVVLRSMIEQCLAPSTGQLATGFVFANGVRDVRIWVGNVRGRM